MPKSLARIVCLASICTFMLVACGCAPGGPGPSSAGAPGSPSPATPPGTDSANFANAAAVDAAIKSAMTEASIPGAIVGIWGPSGNYVRSFGVSDKATGAPMRVDDYTRIGSITKTFTITSMLLLVDAGKLKLDDPIAKYIPGVTRGDKLTLRHLAQMSSGLVTYDAVDAFVNPYMADPSRAYTPQQIVAFSMKLPVQFTAGTKYDYCNTNTALIGLTVEKVSGKGLGDFITENILVPLRLTHTSFPTTAAFPSPHPQGYTRVGETEKVATDWNPSWGWGAGNMISTLEDMRIWAEALGKGTLLKPETQRERITSRVPMNADNTAHYGLGMFNAGGWLGHSGSMFGYQTLVLYLPESSTSLVFFINSDYPHSASTTLGSAITKVISPNNLY